MYECNELVHPPSPNFQPPPPPPTIYQSKIKKFAMVVDDLILIHKRAVSESSEMREQ